MITMHVYDDLMSLPIYSRTVSRLEQHTEFIAREVVQECIDHNYIRGSGRYTVFVVFNDYSSLRFFFTVEAPLAALRIV